MTPGDRVGYARPFLQSVVGTDPTDPMWHRRGTVGVLIGGLDPRRFTRVLWDDGEASIVATCNIAVLGSFKHAHADAPGWIGYGGLGEKPRSPWRKS